MNRVNTLIVDDRNTNIEILKGLLDAYCPTINVVHTSNDLNEAAIAIHQHRPHLLFLDIELNGASGFDLLKLFPQATFYTIFTTAYSQYAADAFRARAVDYLLKPINILELQEAIVKVEEKMKQDGATPHLSDRVIQRQKIALPTLDGIKYIDCEGITHCDASGSYTIIHTISKEKIMVSMRLKECEELLPQQIFFRIHHSHLVNLNFVAQLIRSKISRVVLSTGAELPLAVSRKDAFLELMNRK